MAPLGLTKEIFGFPKNLSKKIPLNNDALLIKCDDDDQRVGFSCLHMTCEINVRGGIGLELGFELYMNKEEIGSNLQKNNF